MTKNAVESDSRNEEGRMGTPHVRTRLRASVIGAIAVGLMLAGPGSAGALDLVIRATDWNGTPLAGDTYATGVSGLTDQVLGPRTITGITAGTEPGVVVDCGTLRVFQQQRVSDGSVYTVDAAGPTAHWGDWPVTEATGQAPAGEAHVVVRFRLVRLHIEAVNEHGDPLPVGSYAAHFSGRTDARPGPVTFGVEHDPPRDHVLTHHGSMGPTVDFGALRVFQSATMHSGSLYTVDTTGPTAHWGDWPMTEQAGVEPPGELRVRVRFLPLDFRVEAVTEGGSSIAHVVHLSDQPGPRCTCAPPTAGPITFLRGDETPFITHHGRVGPVVDCGEGPQAGVRVFQGMTILADTTFVVDARNGGAYWGDWPMTTEAGAGDRAATFRVIFNSDEPADQDDDGVPDLSDNCVQVSNADQVDQDLDDLGNACDADLDGDGVSNASDNCADVANAGQQDGDGDAVGDACDNDADGDLVNDGADNCLGLGNPDQANSDGDAAGDACDPDDDGDGVSDAADNCPLVPNPSQVNGDGDGRGDACDEDDDGDEVLDGLDLCPATPLDAPIDADGCSGTQRVDRACGTPSSHPNHGAYVSCVVHAANAAYQEGLITARERARLVTNAARSN